MRKQLISHEVLNLPCDNGHMSGRWVPRMALWFMPTRRYTVPAQLEYWMDGITSSRNNPRHGARNPDQQIER